MNNKTICRFEIKLRGDNVYDLYVDGEWVASRGCYENILDEIRKEIERIDTRRYHEDATAGV
jgi:hypothetical protein